MFTKYSRPNTNIKYSADVLFTLHNMFAIKLFPNQCYSIMCYNDQLQCRKDTIPYFIACAYLIHKHSKIQKILEEEPLKYLLLYQTDLQKFQFGGGRSLHYINLFLPQLTSSLISANNDHFPSNLYGSS